VTSDMALLITGWRRPRYLKRTLASWAQVPGIQDLRTVTIALGRSERADDQRAVIAQAAGAMGREIQVRPDSDRAAASPGMHRALGEAIAAVFKDDPGLEFLVCGEEDIIVADDVLALLSWERQLRGGHPNILLCEAHNGLGQGWHPKGVKDGTDADPGAVRLATQFDPWVWGIWRDRWKEVIEPAWDWDATKGDAPHTHGYDWQLNRVMNAGGYVAPAPLAARSQNIGRHEGVYANPANFALTQAASFREHFGTVDYRLVSGEA
jgi:hypothetical protein